MEHDNTPTRSWERPWTTEEMRQQSANWSLAGDSGLLKHLQQFSQNLLARTHSTNQKMDDLFEDLRNTTTEVNNVTNSFLSLSNTQFVESRVYDDEDKETPKEEIKVQELSKEQKQAQVVTQVSEALSLGMSVLDTMFSVVQVSGSDSEDEESLSSGVQTILEPKNPYLNRPLPYLIGSKEFMEDDRIGLGDPTSITDDNVSLAPTHSSGSDPEVIPERIVSSSSECSDLESDQGALKRHSGSLPRSTVGETRRQSDSMFDVPDGEDMFGQKSPQESSPPLQVKARGQSSFAEELAAKLGGVAAQDPLAPSGKTSQPARAPSKFADDLFSPEDDDNDSLFGGGKFSTKSGLFDDLDSPSVPVKPKEEKTVPVPAPVKQIPTGGSLFSDDLFNTEEADDDDIFSVSTVKKAVVKVDDRGTEVGDKKPPGGVSIFGKDLFGSSDNAKNAPKRLFSVPDDRDGIFTSTPESREKESDGLFGSRISPIVSKAGTNSSLFANVDDDDLFSSSNSKIDSRSSKVAETSSSTKKLPVGAVSIFGQDLFANSPPKSLSKSSLESDTTSHTASEGTVSHSNVEKSSESGLGQASGGIRSQEFKSTVDEDSSFNPVFASTRRQSGTNSFNDQNAASDLFKEEVSGDSLFQKPKVNLGKSAPASSFATSKPVNRKPVSLFDSDSDESDLFSRTSSPSIRSVDKGDLEKRPLQKKSLFSNDEQLFQTRPNEPNFDIFGSVQAEKAPVPKPSVFQNKNPTTLPVGKSSILEENVKDIDIFAPSTDKTAESKSKSSNLFDFGEDTVDDIFAVPTSKTKSTVNLSDKLFEDVEDLFPVSKPSKSISERLFDDLESGSMFEDESNDIFKGTEVKKSSVSKPEPPSTLNIRKTTDLFSGNDNEDLFGSSIEKGKEKSQSSSSSSKIMKNDNNANKISLFADLDESAIENIFKKSSVSRVKDMVSDVSDNDNDSKTESILEKVNETASTFIKNVKSDTEKLLAEVSESSSKSQKPQVTPKSNVKEANIKTTVRPEIMPRLSKMPTDNTLQDPLKEKPTIAPRTDPLKPNSEISQVEKTKSAVISRPTVSVGQQELPSKGLITEIQGVSKAPSIQERGKIINPAALLPGSRPVKVVDVERSLSFEEVVPTTTLHSAAKERAKIPVKRRPQSRRARQESIRTSAIFDDTSPTSPGVLGSSDESILEKSNSEPLIPEFKSKISGPTQNVSTVKEFGGGDAKQDTSPLSSSGESAVGQPFRAKIHSTTSLFSPETDEGEDLFGMPQDLPDYDPKEDLGGNLFGGAPVLSPLDKRLSSFQSSTSHVTLKDENIPKADSQLPRVSKSPPLFETNSDSLFGSNTTIPKASRKNLFPEEIQSAMQTESSVSKSESNVDTLFGNDSDELFSSNSKSESKVKTEKTTTISNPLISKDKDLFNVGSKAGGNSAQNEQSNTRNVDDLFASSPSAEHSSDIFKKSIKSTNKKNDDVKDDLFPVVSDDKGFESDMDDSLFKAVTNNSSSKQMEKSTGSETLENRDDDLFVVTSKSRPTQAVTEIVSNDSVSNKGAQSKSLPHPHSISTVNANSIDLFGTGSASLPIKPLSYTVGEEDLFSVKTNEDKYQRIGDDDLFGSVPAKSKIQIPVSTKNEDSLFFVKAKEQNLQVKGDADLFGSVPAQVKSQAPILVDEDEDLFSVKASSNTKDVGFGAGNKKSTSPSNHKSQKKSSLFDDGTVDDDDIFSAGPSKRKISNASSTASTIITETQTSVATKKPMKKSLFDDDDDDDIFNTSTSKISGKTLKPAGPVQTKVIKKKSESSKPTTTVSAKQNTDFEDPLMALKRD